MKIKLTIFILITTIAVGIGIGVFLLQQKTSENVFEKNRERVLSQLYLAIEDAEKMGKYKCCIEPPVQCAIWATGYGKMELAIVMK